jgi:alkylation response protein AidB-like acyl-CoA dehydrogenase
MLYIRTLISTSVSNFLQCALQIAIRYASCRRQFATIEGSKEERRIIDYQTQQHILVPLVAAVILQNVTGNYMRELFAKVMDEIEVDKFEGLDVLHHLLAGFKDRQSEEALQGVDICRRATGGAGFLSDAGFTELADVGAPFPTFEGDNTVMVLQASRYIFKLLRWSSEGRKLPFPF